MNTEDAEFVVRALELKAPAGFAGKTVVFGAKCGNELASLTSVTDALNLPELRLDP